MTMIRDIPVPAIDGELGQPEDQSPVKRSISPLVAMLCGSAVLVTVMNVFAALHLYHASREIRAVEARLEELAAYEKRMTDRLALVNTGVQSQFDKLNQDLQTGFSGLRAGMGQLGKNLETIRIGTHDPFADMPTGFESESFNSGPVLAEAQPDVGSSAAFDASRTISQARPSSLIPAISSAYQRKVMPDGKVYYRKVR